MSNRPRDAGVPDAGTSHLTPAARRRVRRMAALLRRTEARTEGLELLLHDVARVLELLADPVQADRWEEITIRYPTRSADDEPD